MARRIPPPSPSRVLLTGATGMVGGALARRLIACGSAVTILARPSSGTQRLDGILDDVNLVRCAFEDSDAIATAIITAKPDVIFHLASTPFNPPIYSADEQLRGVVQPTVAVLEGAKAITCRRLVVTGSSAQYEPGHGQSEGSPIRPANVYGAMKASASLIAKTFGAVHGLEVVDLILFGAFGPWERENRLIPSAILSALDGEDIRIRDGSVERDLLFVDDAIDALLRTADPARAVAGQSINVCSGVGIPVRRFANMIATLVNTGVRVIENPDETRADEIRKVAGDRSKAEQLLDWKPTVALEDGLAQCIAWYAANREISKNLT